MTMLVLASGSTTRAGLLERAGVAFTAIPARVDEDAIKDGLRAEGAPLERVPELLAEMKALRVSAAHPDALVIGADQILAFEGEVVSKSADLDAARVLLRRLRGREHRIVGGTVLAKGGSPVWRHIGAARMTMRHFSDAFLEEYLAREGADALASVGCFRLEGMGAQLFSRVEGDYFSILGLPLLPLLAALREQGVIAS